LEPATQSSMAEGGSKWFFGFCWAVSPRLLE
jgi:hypothetical protein